LSRASGLDAMLDSYAVAAPASELRAQVLRRAESDVTRRRRLRLLWWGLGLFGVGLAGALAGAFAVTIMLPRAMPDALGFSPVAADLPDLGAHSDAGHKDR
jgi:anti-sigma-K factor RskA